jgi:hypothetical protein
VIRALVAICMAATVGRADPARLHVAVRCAHELATPDDDLQLRVDGVPQLGTTEHVQAAPRDPSSAFYYTDDVAGGTFTLAPGHHRLQIATPDCAPIERDVLISPGGSTTISGRLAVTNPRLLGTVGAPDHLGVIAGFFYAAAPATSGTDADKESSWTASSARPIGGWLGLTFERRYLAAAFDWDIGATDVSGVTTNIDPQRAAESIAYTQRGWYMRWAGRVGARLPLHDVALAAGTGLGLELGMPEAAQLEMPTMEDLGARESWRGFFVPVWGSVTYKPVCDFGFVALASYDVHPFAIGSDAVSFAIGATYQPSSACSQPAAVTVTQQ